ncbi:amino acid permease [Vagococcus sp.]|uniref:amino acid permease n=1 Tax=Vagococcus sp. TaxID=1933889 RepID=UPI003F9C81C8
MDKKKMSRFSFFAMTASLFITVYEYPTFAESGKTLIFFLLLCGLAWFLPVALCSAEMATVEKYKEGGIFGWVGKSLGEKYGFAALFFQWFQITVGFVTMIYFIIGSLAYALDMKALNENPMFKFIAVVVIFWLITLMQLRGTNVTAKIAKAGFILGIVVPVFILLFLTLKFKFSGHEFASSFTDKTFLPTAADFPALVTFMLAYMGVEASAPHITELENPKKNYPLIMIALVIVGIVLSTIGGAAVSMVVPGKELSLNSGVVQAFETLLLENNHHLVWLVKIMALLLAFGVTAQVSSWTVSPTEGLRFVAEKGLLPARFKKVNRAGVPVPLLIVQGILVTIWAAILTLGGGGNNVSFLTAISLTVIIYLSAYVLLFIGYFALILKKKNQTLERAYQVPGGNKVKIILAGAGLLLSLLAIISSFCAPKELQTSQAHHYILTLGVSYVITLLVPFVFYHFYCEKKIPKLQDKIVRSDCDEND